MHSDRGPSAAIEMRWRIELACAGHPVAVLRRRDGTVSEPGDTVLVYTDGVNEARRGREWFGDERVREILTMSSHSAAALVDVVLQDVL